MRPHPGSSRYWVAPISCGRLVLACRQSAFLAQVFLEPPKSVILAGHVVVGLDHRFGNGKQARRETGIGWVRVSGRCSKGMAESVRPEGLAEPGMRCPSDHSFDPPGADPLAVATDPKPVVLAPLKQLLAFNLQIAIDAADEAAGGSVFHRTLGFHVLRLERQLPAAVGSPNYLSAEFAWRRLSAPAEHG